MSFSQVCVTASLFAFFITLSISEPVVKLQFDSERMVKDNVGEYAVLDDQDVTITCDVDNIPSPTKGNITLQFGSQTLKKVPVETRPLLWRGDLSRDATISCESILLLSGHLSKVSVNDVKIYHHKFPSGNVTCMTKKSNEPFLLNEVVPFSCVYFNNAQIELGSDEKILPLDLRSTVSKNMSITTNYFRVTLCLAEVTCVRKEGNTTTEMCYLDMMAINIERNLTISIRRENPNENLIGFICETNMPTEYILWSVESLKGNFLDFNYGKNSSWNFTITHGFKSSQLSFPRNDGTNQLNLTSVSCWTYRAGFVSMATAHIDAVSEPTSGRQDHDKGIFDSTTTTIFVDTTNDHLSDQNSRGDAACGSFRHLIFIIGVLALISLVMIVVIGYLLLKLKGAQVTSPITDVMNGSRNEHLEQPEYATVSDSHRGIVPYDSMLHKVDRNRKDDVKINEDHLSVEVLGEDAIVIENKAYVSANEVGSK